MPGFTSNITVIPALSLGVAVCANMRAEPWAVSRRCLEGLAPLVSEAVSTAAVVTPEASWQDYVGRYVWRDRSGLHGHALDIQIQGAQLVAVYRDASGNTEMRLRTTADGGVRIRATPQNELNGELATFTRTDGGQVSGMRIGSHRLERIGGATGVETRQERL